MTGYDSYINKWEVSTEHIINRSKNGKYLNMVVAHMSNLAPRTVFNYIKIINDFLDKSVNSPDALNLDDYNKYMESKRRTVSGNQITIYHALKYFSEYMYISDKAEKDWMFFVKRPKSKESRKTVEKRESGYLKENEIKRLLYNVEHSDFYPNHPLKAVFIKRDICLFYVALTTGLRSAALCKLDIDDINLEDGLITVVDKGDKIQTYNIAKSAINPIKNYISVRNTIMKDDTDAFFISNVGHRIKYDSIYALMKKYGKTIGREDLSPHKLRASYGTALYEKTKDIYFVSQAMGHSGTEVTKIYIRGKQKQIRKDAARLIDDIVGG